LSIPRLEKGYTRIANELLEAILKHPFSKRELNVVLSVIRKTYGYNGKKHDAVSSVQIASMTSIDQSHISKTINCLIEKNVLVKKGKGRLGHGKHIKSVGINKRYKMWSTTTAKTALVVEEDYGQNSPRTTAKTAPVSTAKTAYTKERKEKRKGEAVVKKIKQYLESLHGEDEYSYYRKIGIELEIHPFSTETANEYIKRVRNAVH